MNHKDELIRLTFQKNQDLEREEEEVEIDEDLIPSLELLLKTKWNSNYSIDWNGSEPIL